MYDYWLEKWVRWVQWCQKSDEHMKSAWLSAKNFLSIAIEKKHMTIIYIFAYIHLLVFKEAPM